MPMYICISKYKITICRFRDATLFKQFLFSQFVHLFVIVEAYYVNLPKFPRTEFLCVTTSIFFRFIHCCLFGGRWSLEFPMCLKSRHALVNTGNTCAHYVFVISISIFILFILKKAGTSVCVLDTRKTYVRVMYVVLKLSDVSVLKYRLYCCDADIL